uniref:Lymphoid restricted membrane protein n=1 Tax=Taeniopygia guttata TaxID=59729 RepID=A0A674GSQ1_TAEGU
MQQPNGAGARQGLIISSTGLFGGTLGALCVPGDSSTRPWWFPFCPRVPPSPPHPAGSLCPPRPGFSLRRVHPAATGAGGETGTGRSRGKHPGGAGAVPGCPGGRWAQGQGAGTCWGHPGASSSSSILSPQRLGRSCTNAGCKEMLQQLQHSLAVLSAGIERATSAAEKLGAVHQEARMSRAAEVMVQHVEKLKRQQAREHAELEEMKRLIQQNSRNRQLAETQDDVEPRLRPHPLKRTFQQGSARRRVSIAVIPRQLLPGASPESRAAPAGALEPEGAQCWPSSQRTELEPQGQDSAVTGKLVAEAEGRGSNTGKEEPEQLGLTSKGSAAELWRPWLFFPQHYWVFFWLLLLSITFLLLIRVLELQRLQSAASSKA